MKFRLFSKEMPELGKDIVVITGLNSPHVEDIRFTTGEFALLVKGSFERYIVEGREGTTYISEYDIAEGYAAWAYTEDVILSVD